MRLVGVVESIDRFLKAIRKEVSPFTRVEATSGRLLLQTLGVQGGVEGVGRWYAADLRELCACVRACMRACARARVRAWGNMLQMSLKLYALMCRPWGSSRLDTNQA